MREFTTFEDWKAAIEDKFKPHLKWHTELRHRSGYGSTNATKRGVVECLTPEMANDPDFEQACICCIDGWWPGNFGGTVTKRFDGYYDVECYID